MIFKFLNWGKIYFKLIEIFIERNIGDLHSACSQYYEIFIISEAINCDIPVYAYILIYLYVFRYASFVLNILKNLIKWNSMDRSRIIIICPSTNIL